MGGTPQSRTPGGTSTRSSFLVRIWLTRGHFDTFELSLSPSAHSGALSHVRAFQFAFGSLGDTSTLSSFLVRLRLTSGALPHVRTFSFAFGSLRGHFGRQKN